MRINVLFILSIIILFTYISPLAPLIIDTISNSLTTSILIGNIYFSFLIDLNSNITLFTYDNLFDFSYYYSYYSNHINCYYYLKYLSYYHYCYYSHLLFLSVDILY